jgi:hypothetical protein
MDTWLSHTGCTANRLGGCQQKPHTFERSKSHQLHHREKWFCTTVIWVGVSGFSWYLVFIESANSLNLGVGAVGGGELSCRRIEVSPKTKKPLRQKINVRLWTQNQQSRKLNVRFWEWSNSTIPKNWTHGFRKAAQQNTLIDQLQRRFFLHLRGRCCECCRFLWFFGIFLLI